MQLDLLIDKKNSLLNRLHDLFKKSVQIKPKVLYPSSMEEDRMEQEDFPSIELNENVRNLIIQENPEDFIAMLRFIHNHLQDE
jgi:hypothetical protein